MEGDLNYLHQILMQHHFNPLPPHGGRHTFFQIYSDHSIISIHSLRMEGDFSTYPYWIIVENFNPLPPHGGRLLANIYQIIGFNYFNPLPPHGGRHTLFLYYHENLDIFQSTPSAWRETYSH